jgi:hypothetical protein
MICKMAAALTLTLMAATPCATLARADDVLNPEVNLTREQWLARVEQAKQRARLANEVARITGSAPAPDVGPLQQDRRASERAMRDDTLRPGDIVSTPNGLLLFRGNPDAEHGPEDFVKLPAH